MSITFHPDIVADVNEFIEVSQPFAKTIPHRIPQIELVKLCIGLITEEINKETLPALENLTKSYSVETMAHLLDGIVDSVYVLIWAANMLNLPFNEAWDEVQKKNMAKFPRCKAVNYLHDLSCGQSGVRIVKIDDIEVECSYQCVNGKTVMKNLKTGKVVKPLDWTPPDIFSLLLTEWEKHLLANDPLFQPTILSSSHRKKQL